MTVPGPRARPLLARLAAAAILSCAAFAAAAEPPLGEKPDYTERALTPFPNEGAVLLRAWSPGLNDGYVPQGIVMAEGQAIVSAYAYKAAQAPGATCRLYRMDPATGAVTGVQDLPPRCGHAGGLAYAGDGRLFVADTWLLIEIDLARAFAPGGGDDAVVRQLTLERPVRGSFVTANAGALWIGEYRKPGEAEIRRVPLSAVESPTVPGQIGEPDVTASLTIAEASQGAAFDAQGRLWLAQSTSQYGRIQMVDPSDGRVLAAHESVAGIEGLHFDAEGMLWTVSEAGSQRWLNWPTFAPLVLRLDPARLN